MEHCDGFDTRVNSKQPAAHEDGIACQCPPCSERVHTVHAVKCVLMVSGCRLWFWGSAEIDRWLGRRKRKEAGSTYWDNCRCVHGVVTVGCQSAHKGKGPQTLCSPKQAQGMHKQPKAAILQATWHSATQTVHTQVHTDCAHLLKVCVAQLAQGQGPWWQRATKQLECCSPAIGVEPEVETRRRRDAHRRRCCTQAGGNWQADVSTQM